MSYVYRFMHFSYYRKSDLSELSEIITRFLTSVEDTQTQINDWTTYIKESNTQTNTAQEKCFCMLLLDLLNWSAQVYSTLTDSKRPKMNRLEREIYSHASSPISLRYIRHKRNELIHNPTYKLSYAEATAIYNAIINDIAPILTDVNTQIQDYLR